MKIENKQQVMTITPLRPNLSDKGPEEIAPIDIPNKAALSTGANCGLVICQASNKAGAIKPMIPVSKPSLKKTKNPKTNTNHCSGDNFSRLMTSVASTVLIMIPLFVVMFPPY